MPLSLIVDAAVLLDAVTRTARFAAKETNAGILNSILLRAESGSLTLEATDKRLDFTSAPIPATVTATGVIAVAATNLLNAIKAIGSGPVKLHVAPFADGLSPKLAITAPGMSYNITGQTGAEFPAAPTISGRSATFVAADLCRVFGAIGPCIAPEDNRYGLCGVHIEPMNDRTRFAATDGNRLAWDECAVRGDATFPRQALLPRAAVVALTNLLAGVEGDVTVTPSGTAVAFLSTLGTMHCRWAEADFPDYRQVVSANRSGQTLTVNRESFLRAVDRALPFAGGTDRCTRVTITGGTVTLTTRMMDAGESTIEVTGGTIDADMTFITGVNGRYLRDALTTNKAEIVIMVFDKPLSPIYLVAEGEPFDTTAKALNVLMPMRLE